LALIDTPEVQRLRRIRQLGFTYLVYPGAEHSRFAHSMGVTWLCLSMLERLSQRIAITQQERLVTVAAALLHDVGHGPFSHAVEAVTGVHHEVYSRDIILDPDSGVGRALRSFDETLPAQVAARLDEQEGQGEHSTRPFLSQLVSSQLDADRLDYILRDGHATGVKIGNYDLTRIMALLDVVDGHLAVHMGAREAVEGYLLARFHMYKQVYLHKTSRTAERMLEALLRRASELRADGGRLKFVPHGPLGRLIGGERLDAAAFATLDDMDVWVAIKRWRDEPDTMLAALCDGLVNRRLWKPFVLPTDDDHRADELLAAARSVARVNGYDPAYAALVDNSEDTLYSPYTGVGQRRGIRLVDSAGNATFIEDSSEVVGMLSQLQLRQRLLCVHPALRPAIHRTLRGC
jgi:HD superfamily phosphohydrolase